MAEFDHDLIDEQIDYYRRRAPEYDGSTTPLDEEFADEGLALDAALAAFLPGGEVLEVACGTGSWTCAIAEYADEVTALDSSPEMIRLAPPRFPLPACASSRPTSSLGGRTENVTPSCSPTGSPTCLPLCSGTSGRPWVTALPPAAKCSSSTRP